MSKRTIIPDDFDTRSPQLFAVFCIAAAFGTYFCMYGFRKGVTAATFDDITFSGLAYKPWLIGSQVIGYTLSKFIGIKVISEMPRNRRMISMLGLVAFAEAALFAFAIIPPPYNLIAIFFNGLPLGMGFGLVLAYLEGRRFTEALSAGLCASFIVSSGIVKTVGNKIMDAGVPELWMPCATGLLFVIPLLVSVWFLDQIPSPSTQDKNYRSERRPMFRSDRVQFFRNHSFELGALISIFMMITIMRSIRDDFGVEIWIGLGESGKPSIFTYSELIVMFGVVIVNGLAIVIVNNRRAFLGSLGLLGCGFVLVISSICLFWLQVLPPFVFMVLIGLGMYVPYVAFHTTVFERFIALYREPANIGYLMYLADAIGYLAYIGFMIVKTRVPEGVSYLRIMTNASIVLSVISLLFTIALAVYYLRQDRDSHTNE